MNQKYRVILLDAGHGGIIDGVYQTRGKRSPVWEDGSQYFEGVGNRQIRDELSKMLKKEGIRYFHINEGQKDTVLKERKDLANHYCKKYGTKNCLGISIHSNAFREQKANGYEAYTSEGQNGSDIVAEAYYDEYAKEFPELNPRTDNKDSDRDKESYLYMTNRTACNWLLVENGFHTNQHECRDILMCRNGRKRIAKVLFNVIKRFV